MKYSLVLIGLCALFALSIAYDHDKPENGKQLEETMRSELDDIWVVQWYKKKGDGDEDGESEAEDSEEAEEFDKAIDDLQKTIATTCPNLISDYKFVQADMDPELQATDDDPAEDTDFSALYHKLYIDDDLLDEGSVVTVMFRLHGVKAFGEDLDVKVCDYIEMKKEERKEFNAAKSDSEKKTGAPPPEKPESPTNMLGSGILHLGGS